MHAENYSSNPAIRTNRLIISELIMEDHEFIFELLNSPTWLKFIGDRGIKTPEDARNYIQTACIDSYRKNGFGLYKIQLHDLTRIGLCGLLQRTYLNHPDIGFAVLPAYEGKGYITEASVAVLDYSKSTMDHENYLGITGPDNLGSQRVLEKIGMTLIEKRKVEDYDDLLWIYSISH
jgi:ribosomal-protein-alanine N-acetyltransferase